MKKRIILTIVNLGDGSKSITAEESWYWRRDEGDIADAGFWVQDGERGVELLSFFIPRELTELIDDPEHWTGKRLKISDQLRDFHYADSLDCIPFIDRWPRDEKDIISMYHGAITTSEICNHQSVLFHGWTKLISCWLNDSIPEIAFQLPWWENYLTEELLDFVQIFQQIKKHGVKAVFDNPADGRNFFRYLKVASCCFELISDVCPTVEAIMRFDKGQQYPCLWAGYLWMKYHHLASWAKVKEVA